MDKRIITRIFLNKEFDNTKLAKVYKLTAPNGFSIKRKLCLAKDERELFNNANIIVEEYMDERIVNEMFVTIGDITVKRASDELIYESENEDEARRKYNTLKARIGDIYEFNGHSCESITGEECHKFKSQRKLV